MHHDNDNHTLTYLSVCSGIEAASVAWHPLGWSAVAYSEIEKFPSAVLKHHYPDVPNLGDFTKIDVSTLGRVDILAGYTAIPWRGKPADLCPDGPRYKALGNSWAVPKFTWLGKRIATLMPATAANDNKEAAVAAA